MDKLITSFPRNKVFDKAQFRLYINSNNSYSENSITWILRKLKTSGEILAVGHNKFLPVSEKQVKQKYTYIHSPLYKEIEKYISELYPLLDFQMWELIQLNEFVNHQIAKNTIIVEVEKELEDIVFEKIITKYNHVLYSPTQEDFYRYRGDGDSIVVLNLITEAPRTINEHSCPLEKILVDLFSNKFVGHLIEKSEYPSIFEEAFGKYQINETAMFRYARRRNSENRIKDFIKEKTIIKLATEME